MSKNAQRTILGRGRGYLNAAGPQSRFIIFLIFVLMAYTLLLRVFQKLAEILQLPVFLPISLITLLVFIGIVGTVYSHAFVGPMVRIRRAIDQLAKGDLAVSLRLRESDDPMLKDLVTSITRLCEHSRNTHALIRASAQDLFSDITALQEAVQKDADKTEIRKHTDLVRKKKELLEKAVQSFSKS
jgi:methyl-accepting chemotaxis protein